MECCVCISISKRPFFYPQNTVLFFPVIIVVCRLSTHPFFHSSVSPISLLSPVRDVLSVYMFLLEPKLQRNILWKMCKHRNVLVELLKTCNIKNGILTNFCSGSELTMRISLFSPCFRPPNTDTRIHAYERPQELRHAQKSLFHFNLGFVLRTPPLRSILSKGRALCYIIILVVIFDKAV